MMIALCGCMMQEEKVVAKIKKSYRFVDIIFGTHNIFKLAELMYERLEEKKDGCRHLGGNGPDCGGSPHGPEVLL